jgi:hypothetical protein
MKDIDNKEQAIELAKRAIKRSENAQHLETANYHLNKAQTLILLADHLPSDPVKKYLKTRSSHEVT